MLSCFPFPNRFLWPRRVWACVSLRVTSCHPSLSTQATCKGSCSIREHTFQSCQRVTACQFVSLEGSSKTPQQNCKSLWLTRAYSDAISFRSSNLGPWIRIAPRLKLLHACGASTCIFVTPFLELRPKAMAPKQDEKIVRVERIQTMPSIRLRGLYLRCWHEQ